MSPLFLIFAALPSLLASPWPCSDIYSFVHSSCYNTAPRPCTMESKPLLAVKVQKRISFMSTCHRPNGEKKKKTTHLFLSHYPLGVLRWGWGTRSKSRKKTRTSYKEHNFPVTGDPWNLQTPRPPFPITASPKTSLWQPTPYPPSQLFLQFHQ